jgi:redox-sensing transcriptional repressor
MAYFAGRRPRLSIVAAFDTDPSKVNRVIHGCRCYDIADMARIVREAGIEVAVITVPARAAQDVADALVEAGVKGMLNFAPAPLRVPLGVYVEDIDMTMSLEKVAYFARQGAMERESVQ